MISNLPRNRQTGRSPEMAGGPLLAGFGLATSFWLATTAAAVCIAGWKAGLLKDETDSSPPPGARDDRS